MASLHKHLSGLFHEAKQYGEKAAKDFEEKDIHEMRVAVKKIKAAFLLLQFFYPDLKDDELKKLKKVFGRAGELRECQTLTEAIRKFRGLQTRDAKQSLLDILQEQEKKSTKKFHQQFQKSGNEALADLKKEMLRKRKISTGTELRYFENILHTILQAMRRTDLTETEYHEVRKKLKELKYNLSFASLQSKQSVGTVFSEKELSRLEEALGTWHDQVIIILRLKEITPEKKDLQPFIEKVIRRIQPRHDLLLKKISRRFQKKAAAMSKLSGERQFA